MNSRVDFDLGQAFSFVFDDEEWVKKILIGGLVFLGLSLLLVIPGVLWILGYMLDTARNVARNDPHPLPDLEIGGQISRGFQMFVVSLVYAIPIILAICVFTGLMFIPAVMAGEDPDAAVGGMVVLMTFCIYPLLFLFGLAIQVFVFAGYIIYIQQNSISAAINVGAAWRMVRSQPRTWFILLLLYWLASIIASAGSAALGIGVLFTTVFAQAFFGHVLGQVAAQMSPTEPLPPAATF